jgi:uncharacterized delta-60 repeat protein
MVLSMRVSRRVWGRRTAILFTSLLILLNGYPARAVPGQLDSTFGGDGKVTTDFTSRRDVASSVAIQGDGKLVAVGTANYRGANARFAIARYNTNGTLDPTFGGDGKVATNLTGAWDGAFDIAIQPDGKIVVAGEAGGNGPAESADAKFALARYDSTGSLDNSFSGDGKVITNVSPGADFLFGVAIQEADGKILVAGRAGGSHGRIALARYHTGGSLDASFGSDGKVATNITRFDDRADDVAIQPDGKIVVAGTANYFSRKARFVTVRYNSNGSRDASFSADGIATINLTASFDGAFGLAVQPSDGKIVVVGQAGGGDAGRVGVVRYNLNGSLDGTFSGDGRVFTNFTPRLDYADDVAIQSDGKIVTAGAIRFFGPDPRFAVARFDVNGTLDATFGGDGRITTDLNSVGGGIFGVKIQPADGKIVAVGASGGSGGRFGVVRYLP